MSNPKGRYKGVTADGQVVAWSDKKRYLWLMGLVVPALPLASMWLFDQTGHTAWTWMPLVVFLGLIPLLDLVAGRDSENPPDEVIEALETDKYYRAVVYAYIPLQYLGFVVAMWMIGTQDMSLAAKAGLAVGVGIVAGVAINTAHELGHKKETHERWISKVTLAQSFYGHFYIEHNRGHHVRVATPEDPASAKMGESLYAFWPRTVVGSAISAWSLEKKRYARRNQHPFRVGNDVLNAWVMTVALWGGLMVWLGWEILPFLVINAVVGFSLLEIVNYAEHYGMKRQKVGVGTRRRYERVTPEHSWNSNNIVTNVLLYHLQRHSDHHANPTRSFQALRDFKEAPVLPTGYTGMIVLALFPPLFWKVMDKRVAGHYDGDLRLANVKGSKYNKLVRKFPLPQDTETIEKMDAFAQTFAGEVLAARCPGCNFTYDVVEGNELQGFPAGTAWSEIPDDWFCPDCGVREKIDFVPISLAGVS